MPNPKQEFEKMLGGFNVLASHYLLNVESGKEAELLAAFKTAMKDFSKSSKPLLTKEAKASRGGCPAGWVDCGDGSCMPPGMC